MNEDEPELDAPEAPAPPEENDLDEGEDEHSDFAEPFEGRSFGGEFVWARGARYTCKVLRVRPGEKVLISTRGRTDMVVMLTGGRAILEVIEGSEADADRVEMLPAAPIRISAEREHRLVAMTEVEMFTVYSPLESE